MLSKNDGSIQNTLDVGYGVYKRLIELSTEKFTRVNFMISESRILMNI